MIEGLPSLGVLEMVGEMGRGCDPGKWSVHFPVLMCTVWPPENRLRITSVVSPSAMMTVL